MRNSPSEREAESAKKPISRRRLLLGGAAAVTLSLGVRACNKATLPHETMCFVGSGFKGKNITIYYDGISREELEDMGVKIGVKISEEHRQRWGLNGTHEAIIFFNREDSEILPLNLTDQITFKKLPDDKVSLDYMQQFGEDVQYNVKVTFDKNGKQTYEKKFVDTLMRKIISELRMRLGKFVP